MLGAYVQWIALALLFGGVALTAFGWWSRPRGPLLLCPGPTAGLWAWLSLRRWAARGGCWYNLTGLPEGEGGARRCPECGTTSRPPQRLRDGRRWRPHFFGTLLILIALGQLAAPWIQSGQWVRAVPTPVLAAVECGPQRWQPRPLRIELYRRTIAGELDGLSARLICAKLVRDLADDDVVWNAERASDMLDALWPASRRALETGLVRGDRQTRMIAASLLRERCPDAPSGALLAACAEDLRDDGVKDLWDDGERVEYWSLHNAQDAAVFLCRFPARAAPLLRQSMMSEDWQQRFLAAVIAGFSQIDSLVHRAGPILISNLRDDDVFGNAKFAAPALYRFGHIVIPFLEGFRDDDDRQLRAIVRSIIERIQFPERAATAPVYPMPRITDVTDDPLGVLELSSPW